MLLSSVFLGCPVDFFVWSSCIAGLDAAGRPVIVFVAAHLPSRSIDLDRVLQYVVRELVSVVDKDFVLVYLHANMPNNNQPEYQWLKKALSIITRKWV